MMEEKIGWGWVARIWWGAVWRWFVGMIAAIVLLRLITAILGLVTGHPVYLSPSPLMGISSIFVLFFAGLAAALALALRARHGGLHLAVISSEDQAQAFE